MSCCAQNKTCCGGGGKEAAAKAEDFDVHHSVQEFYTAAQKRADLGCCPNPCSAVCELDTRDKYPKIVDEALKLIHEDVLNSYFGCGLPYPSAVEGSKILDLGSGTGRDCFLLGYLAGRDGRVVGVDMTPAMLERSRSMIGYHAEKFGFENVEFKQGYLESLDQVEGIGIGTYDIIISNCVINLAKDKYTVFKHAFNLLKPGGELCFADVYTDKPLPKDVRENALVWNECFGGSLVYEEFAAMNREIGFLGPFSLKTMEFNASGDTAEVLKGLNFWSKTERLFKPGPGGARSDGGTVVYLGTIPGCPEQFDFTETLGFKKDVPTEVDSAVYSVLESSRFQKHFKF